MHADENRTETTTTTSFDPLTTHYSLTLPFTDTNYTIQLVVTSDRGTHPPAVRSIRTLPYINCVRTKFDPATCHKNIAVSQDRTEIRHRKCQFGAFYNECSVASSPHRLERLEGSTVEEPFTSISYVYWEYLIHFHIFGRLNPNSLICDIGFCQQGTENQASSLCDNTFGCSAFLVRRRDKICVEFWNGPNRQCISRSVPVLDLNKAKFETIRLGFFYKGPEQGVSVVCPNTNAILCRFEPRFGSVLPLCALYNGGHIYVSIKCLHEEVKLPPVLSKLVDRV